MTHSSCVATYRCINPAQHLCDTNNIFKPFQHVPPFHYDLTYLHKEFPLLYLTPLYLTPLTSKLDLLEQLRGQLKESHLHQ